MKVGFIGLGVQGKHLAINIAQAGHDVMVYDVRPEPLAELARAQAKIARSNSDVGAHADVVCVCVLNDEQVASVLLDNGGVLATARPGTIVAIHSTIDPETIERVAAAGHKTGVEVIDAPVSGSEAGAKNRTMLFMVGGSAGAFEKCRPVFAASGSTILHTGDRGTAIRAKIAHQLITAVNMLSAYEGMRLGVAAGLPASLLEQVVHAGSGQSRLADSWSKLAFGSHAEGVFYKDLKLCLKLAHELNVPVPAAALAQQMLHEIVP